jgi:hypothetical protein
MGVPLGQMVDTRYDRLYSLIVGLSIFIQYIWSTAQYARRASLFGSEPADLNAAARCHLDFHQIAVK